MSGTQCCEKFRYLLRQYTLFIERLDQQSDADPAATQPWFFFEMADALDEKQYISSSDPISSQDSCKSNSILYVFVRPPVVNIPL